MELISVKERLPDDQRPVLVFIAIPKPPCGEYDIGCWLAEDEDWYIISGKHKGYDVTHWAELPEAPQAEAEEE